MVDKHFPRICCVHFYPARQFIGGRDFSPTPEAFSAAKCGWWGRKGHGSVRSRNLAWTAGLAGKNIALIPDSLQAGPQNENLSFLAFWGMGVYSTTKAMSQDEKAGQLMIMIVDYSIK